MALLGTLREKGGKAVAIMVGLALVLFLVSSLFSDQNFSMFGGSNDQNPTIIEVNGKKIDQQKFEAALASFIRTREINGMTIDEETRTNLRSQLANQMYNDYAFNPILEKLGIDISDPEMGELLYGSEPHPYMKQYFGDQYSPERAKNFMKNDYVNDLKAKLALDEYIAAIKIDVKSKKYLKLVSAGLRATNFDALSESEKDGAAVTGKVVLVNFSTVPDSTIEVSDSELKSYLAKHSDDFKAEDSRDIEYVLWDVKASKDDSLTTLGELDNLKQGFESAEDDSAYAVSYSDQKQVEGFRDHGNFKSDDEVGLFSAEVGTVYGPIAADGGFGLFKIKEKTQGENFYNFSQIQLNTIKDSAGTAQKVDMIMNAIASGQSFESLAIKYSEGPTAQDGGKMGWLNDAPYVTEPVWAFVKSASKGAIKVVTSMEGFHIVKINENPSATRIKVTAVVKSLEVGRATINQAFGAANEFSTSVNGKEDLDFINKASAKNLAVKNAVKLAQGAKGWPGLANGKDVIKWTYEKDRKIGDVSQPFSIDNQIVVARVRKLTNEGVANLDDVREEVKTKVLNQKKGELLAKKVEDAMKDAKDAVSLALKFQTIAQPIEGAIFSQNSIQYVGSDGKVQGVILAMQKGKHSTPIIGEQGVYVFYCENVTFAPAATDLEQKAAMIQSKFQQSSDYQVDEILKKQANFKNNVDKFY